MSAIFALVLGVALAGCDALPVPDFEQMIAQHALRPYGEHDAFADGRAMRTPPAGTVSRRAVIDEPARTKGLVGGSYVTTIPIALDHAALERGETSFDVFCAPCHGPLGDGDSMVARHMAYRRPRSLVAPPVTEYAVGRIFSATEEGYGLMPSYRHQLSADERWEIVGYLRALQLSQAARLQDLPADVRARVERMLP